MTNLLPQPTPPPVTNLGTVPYADAFAIQTQTLDSVLAARETNTEFSPPGRILFVEHPPVITVSRRASAASNVLATPQLLAKHGVELCETDRGGDVTYHGPGQIVCYPILDLNALNLGIHDYMRLLEQAVINTCADLGLTALRDPPPTSATGVWIPSRSFLAADNSPKLAKVAAMGVRVRRWISMHGLSLNVNPNLNHFNLIVPCGLPGRPVTTLDLELPNSPPTFETARQLVEKHLLTLIAQAHAAAIAKRSEDQPSPSKGTE